MGGSPPVVEDPVLELLEEIRDRLDPESPVFPGTPEVPAGQGPFVEGAHHVELFRWLGKNAAMAWGVELVAETDRVLGIRIVSPFGDRSRTLRVRVMAEPSGG